MASTSLNDKFIWLQLELKELKNDKHAEELSFHYHQLSESIERKMSDLIGQCTTDISNFRSLVKELKDKQNQKDT
jgi:glucose-6-phosphate-specific signal transduction histidine kinase